MFVIIQELKDQAIKTLILILNGAIFIYALLNRNTDGIANMDQLKIHS